MKTMTKTGRRHQVEVLTAVLKVLEQASQDGEDCGFAIRVVSDKLNELDGGAR